jgi:hypothetical protein
VSEPIKSRYGVDVDIYPTRQVGIALNLKFPKGTEAPAFLSPDQARDAAQRLITAATLVENQDV